MKKGENKLQNKQDDQVGRHRGLEGSSYQDIADSSLSANAIVSDNFYVKENVGRAMLSDFYVKYRRTINELNERLSEKEKGEISKPLSSIMNQNENKFYNSSVNLMVSDEKEIEKLNSAIQTSSISLNVEEIEEHELEDSFIAVCDSVLHFFDRLNVYKLLPLWSFGFRVSEATTQRWLHSPEGYTYEGNLKRIETISFSTNIDGS